MRRFPFGAEVLEKGGVHFRILAPRRRKVELLLNPGDGTFPIVLEDEGSGFFSALVKNAEHGTRYKYRLDGESVAYPDPASRFQPEGPHEASQVINPTLYKWSDHNWPGVHLKGQILYEMHIGTFTTEGTWNAAALEIENLKDIGITVLELMPVCEFPGPFGWGYDGVDLFAPSRLYGTPDDFRRFVDCAHAAGLGVILDVVYNHLGPEGNYIEQYIADFFTDKYPNEWGKAINFDGEGSNAVREFFIANVHYWIEEFHIDGFRFDATQQIFDNSLRHILSDLTVAARNAASPKSVILIAENENQTAKIARNEKEGGYGLDALWNDDFHHSSIAALVGVREAYLTDFFGSPQEFVSAAKYGYLYQGQYYSWQKKCRGEPSRGIRPEQFVTYIENHDQVANTLYGKRLHQLTSPGHYRAITALMLLMPGTPLLFQGQEFASSSPFLFFSKMSDSLAVLVQKGRGEFLAQFPGIASSEAQKKLANPSDLDAFVRCKLKKEERLLHTEAVMLHRDLLRLRREDPVFQLQAEHGIDGAVIAPQAFLLRFFGLECDDRLVIVNLGAGLHFSFIPEPLAAPPENRQWRVLWSSEDVRYGGGGIVSIEDKGNLKIPGYAAIVLEGAVADSISEEGQA